MVSGFKSNSNDDVQNVHVKLIDFDSVTRLKSATINKLVFASDDERMRVLKYAKSGNMDEVTPAYSPLRMVQDSFFDSLTPGATDLFTAGLVTYEALCGVNWPLHYFTPKEHVLLPKRLPATVQEMRTGEETPPKEGTASCSKRKQWFESGAELLRTGLERAIVLSVRTESTGGTLPEIKAMKNTKVDVVVDLLKAHARSDEKLKPYFASIGSEDLTVVVRTDTFLVKDDGVARALDVAGLDKALDLPGLSQSDQEVLALLKNVL